MSSMCGIVDFENKRTDFATLRAMGHSMILRGQDQSGAYLHGGIGFFHNRRVNGEEEETREPLTETRNGKNYTVMFDGELAHSRDRDGYFHLQSFGSAAEAVLYAYLSRGLDFAPYVSGAFSFAVCDEYRGEVILARDAFGRKPLYYSYSCGTLTFASEIKGMLRYLKGEARVNRGALQRYLLSSFEEDASVSLYPDITELPPGHCAVFSRIGVQVFPLQLPSVTHSFLGSEDEEILTPKISSEDLSDSVMEALLLAFDYPAFDVWMPGYWKLLESARQKQKRTVRVFDGTRRYGEGYSYLREDRLAGCAGISVEGVPLREEKRREKAYKEIERALSDMVAGKDARLLSRLYGERALAAVREEKDIHRKIRMLGILWQSVSWAERYRLMLVSEKEERAV